MAARSLFPLIFFSTFCFLTQDRKINNKRWYCLARIVRKIYCCFKKNDFYLTYGPDWWKFCLISPLQMLRGKGIPFPRQWVGRMVFLLYENIISLPLTPSPTAFPFTNSWLMAPSPDWDPGLIDGEIQDGGCHTCFKLLLALASATRTECTTVNGELKSTLSP